MTIVRVLSILCVALAITATKAYADVSLAAVPTIAQTTDSGGPTWNNFTIGGQKTLTVSFTTTVPQGDGIVCIGRSNEDDTGDLRMSTFSMTGGSPWNTDIPDMPQGGMQGMQRLVVFDKIAGASEPPSYTFSSTLVPPTGGTFPAIGVSQALECYDIVNANPNHVVGRVAVAAVTPDAKGNLIYPRQFVSDLVGNRVISGFDINQEIPIIPGNGFQYLDNGMTNAGSATGKLSYVDTLMTLPVQAFSQALPTAATLASLPPSGATVLGSFVELNSNVSAPNYGNFFQHRALNSGLLQRYACATTNGIGTLSGAQLAEFTSENFGCVRGPSVGQPQASFTPYVALCNAGMHVSLQLDEFQNSRRVTPALMATAVGYLPAGCVDRFEGPPKPDTLGAITSDPSSVVYTPVANPVLTTSIGSGGTLMAGTRCYVGRFTTNVGTTAVSNEICNTIATNASVTGSLALPASIPSGFQGTNITGGRLYEGPTGGPYSYVADAGVACAGPCVGMLDDGSKYDVVDTVATSDPNTSVDFAGVYTRDYYGWAAEAATLGVTLMGESLTNIVARTFTPTAGQNTIQSSGFAPYTYRYSPDREDIVSTSHGNCGAGPSADACAALLYENRAAFQNKISMEWGMGTMEPQGTPCAITGTASATGSCGNPTLVDTTVQAPYVASELFTEAGLRGYQGFYYNNAWDSAPNNAANAPTNFGLLCADKLQEKPAATELKWLLSHFKDSNTVLQMDALGIRFDSTTGIAIPPRFHVVLVQNPTTRVVYLAVWNGVTLQPQYNGFDVGGIVLPTSVPMQLTVQNAPQPLSATYDEFQSSSGLPIVRAAPFVGTLAADGTYTYTMPFNLNSNITLFELAPPIDAPIQPSPSSFSTPSPGGYAPAASTACP